MMPKTNDDRSEGLNARLAALGGFCSAFEKEGFTLGEWRGGKADARGDIQMPYFAMSEAARAFVQHCHDNGWIDRSFDWSSWKQSVEAAELRDRPEAVASASPDTLAKLLTVLMRQERFAEGTLADAYQSGLLMGILRRAAQLAESRPIESDRS